MQIRHFAAAFAAFVSLSPALAQDAGGTSEGAAAKPGPIFTPSDRSYPWSTAVQVGDVLYLSGQIGEADEGGGLVPGGIEPETRQVLKLMGETLASHGLGFEALFKCTVMLANIDDRPAFSAIYKEHFEQGRFPARSAMGVSGLAMGASVELECLAWNPR